MIKNIWMIIGRETKNSKQVPTRRELEVQETKTATYINKIFRTVTIKGTENYDILEYLKNLSVWCWMLLYLYIMLNW